MTTNKSFVSRNWSWLSIILLLLLYILYLLFGRGQETDTPPRPDDPPRLTINEVKNPIAVAIMDANRLLDQAIGEATVTLIDPEGMVVTSNGLEFTTITVRGGVLSLALKPQAEYNQQAPYRFTLEVAANGYSTNIKNILVRSDADQYVPFYLVKLTNPPVGSATFAGALSLNAGVLEAGSVLTPQTANGISVDNLQIGIPPGTQPIYCDGENPNRPFPDSLRYRISYGGPLNPATGRTFPGGAIVTDAANMDGSPAATPGSPITFTTAGWINLEMDADGAEVNGFTQPLTIQMPIPDSLLNPQTGQFFVPGDEISTWSLNGRGAWREESRIPVEGTTGGLFATMSVTHLSTWNLDNKDSPCPDDLIVSYTNGTGSNVSLYSELIRRSDGLVFGITGASQVNNQTLNYLSGGGDISIANTPDNTAVDFIVYNNSTGPGTVLTSTGSVTINCGSQPTPSISIPAGTSVQELAIAVQLLNGGTQIPICNALWFKECTSCDATEGTDCLAQTASTYNYGGILSVNGAGTYGETTLRKIDPDDFASTHCLRLWYAGTSGGSTVAETIDIPVDFSVSPSAATPENLTGKADKGGGVVDDVQILHWVESGTHIFRITSGVTVLGTCGAS